MYQFKTMKKAAGFLLSLFLFSCSLSLSNSSPVTLVINEVMSSNYQFFYDKAGNSSDWVEILNTGTEPINLAGVGLSDSDKNPFKFTFPKITLEPGQMIVVFCSGGKSLGKELHAPFKLKAAGEKVILSTSEGSRIDTVTLPELTANVSYGRPYSSPGEFKILSEPTPRKQNTDEFLTDIKLSSIQSNISSYWCDEGTELVLTCNDENSTIHYTLDGSEPDLTSPVFPGSLKLSAALYPDKTLTSQKNITERYYPPQITGNRGLVIRAKAYAKGYYPSDIFTQSVFFTDIKKVHTMPVALITIDPEDLLDETDGIYVLGDVYKEWRKKFPHAQFQGDSPANYNQRGPSWRRNAYTEFIDREGGFSIPTVFKLIGGWSRSNPQKSFHLFFYERGDTLSGLTYPLFPGLAAKDESGRSTDFFRSVIFRNGGNDYNYTLFRDSLIQSQASTLPLDTQASRPAAVYLNGEYWGILNMREAHDESYFYRHYGIPLDASKVYEFGGDVRLGDEEDYTWYRNLIGRIRESDFSKPEALDQFKESIDFKNHALYLAVQIYIANKDWPGNNIRFWKTDDTPLRWLLYDTEFSTNIYDPNHYTLNMFHIINAASGPEWPNPSWSTELIRNCLVNSEYRRLLINACCDLMNTVFAQDSIEAAVQNMQKKYENDIALHWSRWRGAASGSMSRWLANGTAVRAFFIQRKSVFSNQMKAFFNLSESVPVTVSAGRGGKVVLNNLTFSNEEFTGEYYPDQNIELTAVPDEGWVFSHWTGTTESKESKVSLNPADTISVSPVFIEQ